MRFNCHGSCRCSRTHSPCSQLHARPAERIAASAGGLLPHPFTPGQPALVGLLSVAVVVTPPTPASLPMPTPAPRPHLLFREATSPARLPQPAESREVPLPVKPAATAPFPLHSVVNLLDGRTHRLPLHDPSGRKSVSLSATHVKFRAIYRSTRLSVERNHEHAMH